MRAGIERRRLSDVGRYMELTSGYDQDGAAKYRRDGREILDCGTRLDSKGSRKVSIEDGGKVSGRSYCRLKNSGNQTRRVPEALIGLLGRVKAGTG